jgi:hypothetical protein
MADILTSMFEALSAIAITRERERERKEGRERGKEEERKSLLSM